MRRLNRSSSVKISVWQPKICTSQVREETRWRMIMRLELWLGTRGITLTQDREMWRTLSNDLFLGWTFVSNNDEVCVFRLPLFCRC